MVFDREAHEGGLQLTKETQKKIIEEEMVEGKVAIGPLHACFGIQIRKEASHVQSANGGC